MAFGETADLAVRLSLDDRFTSRIGRAQSALGRFSASVGKVGKGVGQLGAGLGRATVVGIAAVGTGLTAVAKAAIDFEDAFAGVRKTVDEADLAAAGLTFDDLARSFRDMATEIPIAATELARIGETAGALGIAAQDIDDFTKTVALLGETTDLTSDAAAEALGKVGTILNLTGQDFEDFADVLVNLGNQGASTESEIIEVTKRFAAMGRQAGLATPEILALASAATSLGAEPEAAGSALSRIFANMSTEIANTTDKGKAFAKITGKSITELQRMINRGEALPILLDTLKGLSRLSRTEAASTLKALGINNVRDRDAILKMAQNLGFVNEQLQIAGDSTGALGREAEKRFDTVASKIRLFRNNLVEAAITIGEGFAPALGRAAEKLSEFLKQDANRSALKQLGEDIGRTIDGIKWDEVLRGAREFVGLLRTAGGVAVDILKVLNTLPTEVKALGLGLIGLNKLSGGLIGTGIGNIVGGLGESLAKSLASRIPLFGQAFVQPVFVTNLGALGGGVGGVAGKGGGGVLGKGLGLLTGLTGVGIVAGLAAEFGDEIQGLGRDLGRGWRDAVDDALGVKIPTIDVTQLEWPFGPKNTPTILPEIFGGNGLLGGTGTAGKNSGTVAKVTNSGMSPDERQAANDLRNAVQQQTDAARGDTARIVAAQGMTTAKVGSLTTASTAAIARVQQATTAAAQLTSQSARETTRAIQGAVPAVRDSVERTRGAVATMQAATTGRLNAVNAVLGAVRSATLAIAPALTPKLAGIGSAVHGTTAAINRKDLDVDVTANTYVTTNVSVRDLGVNTSRKSRFGYSHT